MGCETRPTLGIEAGGGVIAGTWLFLRLVSDPPTGWQRDNAAYRSTIDWYRPQLAWLATATVAFATARAADWFAS